MQILLKGSIIPAMTAETTPMPADYSTRMGELVSKARSLQSRAIARSSDVTDFRVARYLPDDGKQQEQRRLRRDAVLFDILTLRAEEIAAGQDHRMFGGDILKPYSELDIDVHLADRYGTSFDHELSQNEVEIFVGYDIFRSTVDAIARTQGLTSLDIIALIGEPDHGGRSSEDSAPQSLRFIREIIAVQQHRARHPESAVRMDEIQRNLAERLIHLRKTKPGNPLVVGMQRLNFDTGEGMILFASKPKYDDSYGPIRILDEDGNLDKRVAIVPATPELEALATAKPKDWYYLDGQTGYDFWVTAGEDGSQSVVWNQEPEDYSLTSEEPGLAV